MLESIYNFDWSVFKWIENNLWCGALDVIFKCITYLGEGGCFWIVLAIAFMLFPKYRKIGWMMLGGLLCSLIINDNIIKLLVARPRPFNLYEVRGALAPFYEKWETFVYPNIVSKPSSYSFPSGHTGSSFAAAVPAFIKNKKVGIPLLILATFIGFSRIYLHVHYATDVLMAVVAGSIYGIISYFIFGKLLYPILDKKVFSKIGKKKKSEKAVVAE